MAKVNKVKRSENCSYHKSRQLLLKFLIVIKIHYIITIRGRIHWFKKINVFSVVTVASKASLKEAGQHAQLSDTTSFTSEK